MKILMKSKKIVLVLLSLCAMLCACLALNSFAFTAKAEGESFAINNKLEGFTQEDGASIRYSTDSQVGNVEGDTGGIRFEASVTNAALDEITDNGQKTISEVGMLIVKGNGITKDNVATALQSGSKHSAAFDKEYAPADDGAVYKYKVAVYGISDNTKKYAALAYITVDGTDYFANVATEGSNIRSVFQVAEKTKAEGYKTNVGTANDEQKGYINGLINGVTKGVAYAWDDATQSYYVSGVEDATALETALGTGKDKVLRILSEYETIDNGKANVTYIGREAFRYSTSEAAHNIPVLAAITHLIFPESVTAFKYACCYNMTNLTYVAMPGFGTEETDLTDASNTNQFRSASKLTTIIVNKYFKVTRQCFSGGDNNSITVCALNSGGKVLTTSNAMIARPDGENGGAPITPGDAACGSKTWKYADNGYDVVVAKDAHEYTNGKCSCGAYNTMGVTYEYVAGANDDAANGVYTGSYQVADITGDHSGDATDAEKALLEHPEGTEDYILRILEKYDDGIHGELDVTSVKASAFHSTASGTTKRLAREVTHLILPSTVTTLNQLCFMNMPKLKYVDMRGVQTYGNAPFNGVKTVEQMIVYRNLRANSALGFSANSTMTFYTVEVANTEKDEYISLSNNSNVTLTNGGDGPKVTPLVMGTDWEYDTDGYTIMSITAA